MKASDIAAKHRKTNLIVRPVPTENAAGFRGLATGSVGEHTTGEDGAL